MGSKSSSMPAPDPRIADAQIHALNNKTSLAGRIVGVAAAHFGKRVRTAA